MITTLSSFRQKPVAIVVDRNTRPSTFDSVQHLFYDFGGNKTENKLRSPEVLVSMVSGKYIQGSLLLSLPHTFSVQCLVNVKTARRVRPHDGIYDPKLESYRYNNGVSHQGGGDTQHRHMRRKKARNKRVPHICPAHARVPQKA